MKMRAMDSGIGKAFIGRRDSAFGNPEAIISFLYAGRVAICPNRSG
jgi:hypothetical protein